MATQQANILIIDDDPDVLTAANLLLKRHYRRVQADTEAGNIPAYLEQHDWDVILLDMNFEIGANSGEEGLHWLARIKQAQPSAAVILMTAYGAVDTAVKAIKHGAIDFVLKPWHNERLLTTINNVINLKQSREEVVHLRSRQQELQTTTSELIGDSFAMQRVREMIARVAPTDANVLIQGENGTGKELVARAIYQQSARHKDVFVTVDLGAVSENLFESELFGHKKGAFTGAGNDRIGRFQAASGGTLFLDEISNLPLHLQSKLLTALERREVTPVGANKPIPIDVRLICASNKALPVMVQEGSFREDLLYRINTVEISVPPLRERSEDIALLLRHFIGLYCRKYQFRIPSIPAGLVQKLEDYPWPGNVRELRHAVERSLIMSDQGNLNAMDMLLGRDSSNLQFGTDENLNLESREREAIIQALKKHQGNISKTARALGLTRASLYRRMDKYGL